MPRLPKAGVTFGEHDKGTARSICAVPAFSHFSGTPEGRAVALIGQLRAAAGPFLVRQSTVTLSGCATTLRRRPPSLKFTSTSTVYFFCWCNRCSHYAALPIEVLVPVLCPS